MVRWFLFVGWVALAPYLLLRRMESLPTAPWPFHFELPRIDLLGHVVLFWLGAWVTVWALSEPPRSARRVWRLGVAVAFYGAVLEVLQYYVPGRSVEVSDIAANLCGAMLAATSLRMFGATVVLPRRAHQGPSQPRGGCG